MKLSDLKVGDIYIYSRYDDQNEIFLIKNIETINRKIELTTMWIETNYSDVRFVRNSINGSIYCHGTPAHLTSPKSRKISTRQVIKVIFETR